MVTRLDSTTGRVVSRIRTPGTGDFSGIAVGKRAVWVTATGPGVVYRIDPVTDRVAARVHIGGSPVGVALGAGRVWVTRPRQGPGQLAEIDPRDDRVMRVIKVGPGPGQVVFGLKAVWVQNTSPASVMRVDPVSGRVTTVIGTAPRSPGFAGPAIAVGYRSLWSVANGSLTRLDPSTYRVIARVRIPRATALTLAAGKVWVLVFPRSSSRTIFRPSRNIEALWEIDPSSYRVLDRQRVKGDWVAITANRTHVWVGNYNRQTVTQLRLAQCRRSQTSSRG